LKIQYTKTLPTDLSDSHIFIDSTALINASKSSEFLNLLIEIRDNGCTFYTIPSVVYEYTRTSNTIKGYNERLEFVKDLKVVVFNRVEEVIEKDSQIFLTAYNSCFKESRGPSYTDSLLCTIAYKHRAIEDAYVLTSNHKDRPAGIFDRSQLITIDIKGDLCTEILYKFSSRKFSNILTKLESQQ